MENLTLQKIAYSARLNKFVLFFNLIPLSPPFYHMTDYLISFLIPQNWGTNTLSNSPCPRAGVLTHI